MPELPEVEVTRLSLDPALRGALVLGARVGKPLRWPLGCDCAALSGLRVGPLQRRGKYLWMPLADAQREGGLLWHLGMSGSLSLQANPPAAGPHVHFELRTSVGKLRLTDPRRFGAVVWSQSLAVDPARRLLSRLGAEPFDPAFTAHHLRAQLKQRRCAIKPALLAGDVVVGAGNIYVSEALFRSGIDPRTRCHRIGAVRCERLLAALRQTLARAIELGGSTLRDFRDAHGNSGGFQSEAMVYGREGQACPRCQAPIKRMLQGQRATYFCARCQKA